MSVVDITSGRLHSEFVRLLFLQAHRQTDRFLQLQEFSLRNTTVALPPRGLLCPAPWSWFLFFFPFPDPRQSDYDERIEKYSFWMDGQQPAAESSWRWDSNLGWKYALDVLDRVEVQGSFCQSGSCRGQDLLGSNPTDR
jgi:hypothetical protein